MKLRGECWVITDDAAGNQRQALALAEQLGLPMRHLQLAPGAPWSWLAPRFTLGATLALPQEQRHQCAPPWPAVAIGCGRTAALYTRALRGWSGGRSFTVQILDPRIDPAHWDTVIAPRHDRLSGPNVMTPLGSLHPVDDDWLRDSRDAWPAVAALPCPRVGVLVGGPRKGVAINVAYATQLAMRLRSHWHTDGGSLLVLTSRRTPTAVADCLREQLAGVPGLHWNSRDDGPNPYPGVLGWANRLVVTPDSVNMLSEACAVGCPVATLVPASLPDRLERFHRALREAGYLSPLDAPVPPKQPLRETGAIAAVLRERIAARQAE